MLLGVTVVDPDGAVSRQTHLMQRYAPTFLSTTPPLERYRYFLPGRELPKLARQLSGLRGRVAMLGPGNLHHLTAAAVLALGLRAPAGQRLCLVVFDAHPDWGPAPPGYVHCGSWVRKVLAMRHVRRVVLVGTGLLGSPGLLKPGLLSGLRTAWRAGRLSVFPALACTAEELRQALGLDIRPASLEEAGPEGVLERLAALVEEAPVYVSVDKDVLHPGQLPGLWPGGWLEVDQLVGLVEGLVRRVGRPRLVGADICGECKGWLAVGPPWLATEAHQEVNLKLLSALLAPPAGAAPKRPPYPRLGGWMTEACDGPHDRGGRHQAA